MQVHDETDEANTGYKYPEADISEIKQWRICTHPNAKKSALREDTEAMLKNPSMPEKIRDV